MEKRRGTDRNNSLADFFRDETASGVVLLAAAALAMIWANSPLSESYFSFWQEDLTLGFGELKITLDLQHWVNDLLMVLFFFVVGLEIKRELVTGELSSRRAAMLPAIAAVGGVIMPAIIFLAVSGGGDATPGWAVPVATDIAFAIGVLALLGDRVSSGVRVFLLAVAIIDDIIAIGIIAVFYSSSVEGIWLLAAVGIFAVTYLCKRFGISRVSVYVLLGGVAWLAVFESGVHATIAGVVLGLMTPTALYRGRPIHDMLEHRLHPISAFIVIPIFALANAGVDLRGGVLAESLSGSLTWAITSGLVIGKLVGVSLATLLAIKLGLGTLPRGMRRAQIWGIAALAGIGFTVSLFITDLAFEDQLLIDESKVGIFLGSAVAGVVGLILTARLAKPRKKPE